MSLGEVFLVAAGASLGPKMTFLGFCESWWGLPGFRMRVYCAKNHVPVIFMTCIRSVDVFPAAVGAFFPAKIMLL